MTPSVESAGAQPAEMTIPTEVLDDGEVVLLAVKPSAWFVLLVSGPVLLAAAAGAGLMELFGGPWPRHAGLLVCLAAACLRLVVACFQWMGLLYVLTNRRTMRLAGLTRGEAVSCRLREINDVTVAWGFLESRLGVGSLRFAVAGRPRPEADWTTVSRPEQVRQKVLEAISQAR